MSPCTPSVRAAITSKFMEMNMRQKRILKEYQDREDRRPENGMADHIRGYDDGEPQTSVDFNHYNGAE